MTNKAYLWVVELYENGEWVSTVESDITRQAARNIAKRSSVYDGEKRRVRKYVRADAAKRVEK